MLLQEELRDYQERTSKRFGKPILEGGSNSHAATALQALSLHEAVFLTLAGHFQPVQTGTSLVDFTLTPLGEESLKDRLHSANLQNFTEGAIRATMHAALANLPNSGRIEKHLHPNILDALEAKLLDSYFSLSARMQCDPIVQPLIADARQLCRWTALLELSRLNNAPEICIDTENLERLHLNPALPEMVVSARADQLSSDRGIQRIRQGTYSLGDTSLGHAITCCKPVVLKVAAAGEIGKAFETHAKSYVAECVASSDYQAFEGFKWNGKGGGPNYDCDMIIYEPKGQNIYFLQVKWKRDARTANIEDELELWRSKDSLLPHGLSQLQGLRQRLLEPKVLSQIRGRLKGIRLTNQQIQANSHYVVVHTLPYFNAYQIDGITMYEWNFFRNVLLRGEVQKASAPNHDWARLHALPAEAHEDILPLEQPQKAIDHFYSALKIDPKDIPKQLTARMRVRYGFDVAIKTSFWRRWRDGRRIIRVTRPYL